MNPNSVINISVSNHYKKPGYDSEIITQGILGEKVEIIDRDRGFSRILQRDGYMSWVDSGQLTETEYGGTTITCTDHFVRIYGKPSTGSEGIKDAVIGCCLKKIDEIDEWYQVELPTKECGWVLKEKMGRFPDCTPENIIKLAKQFLGYQYFWGGRTPKGFDCSGFIQTVFGLLGVDLARDAWQQQKENEISADFQDAEPGDLLFFAKSPEKVTHVALALGAGRYIHASSWVRINSLMSTESDFNEEHLKTFVSVNRYL